MPKIFILPLLGVMQRNDENEKKTILNKKINKMLTHIPTHLQFSQADIQAKNCKRVEILPVHKDRIV